MGNTAKFVAGGLLSGAGGGMIAQAEDMRLAALERARERSRAREQKANLDFRASEGRADRRQAARIAQSNQEHAGGLIRSVETTEDGRRVAIRADGSTADLGFMDPLFDPETGTIRAKGKAGGDDDGLMSASDKRIFDAAVQRETTKSATGEKTNWSGVARRLTDMGRPDLAMLAGAGGGVDVESPEYKEAQRRAEAWASGEAGLLSRDSTDFADYGGNRQEAIRQKTMEFYNELTGRGGKTAPPTDTEAPDTEVPAADTQQAGNVEYDSAEAVRDAFREGDLSREAALKILRDKFGYQ